MIDKRFKVTISDNGKELINLIDKDIFIIGRSASADVMVKNDLISRQQVRIESDEGKIFITDLGSSNGSWIAEMKLNHNEKTEYIPGQELILGKNSGISMNIEILEKTSQIKVSSLADGFDTIVPLPEKSSAPKLVTDSSEHKENSTSAGIKKPVEKTSSQRVIKHEPVSLRPSVPEPKSEDEKDLFEKIRQMVSSKAEAIHEASLEEARVIKLNAENEAGEIIIQAKKSAEETYKASEKESKKIISKAEEVATATISSAEEEASHIIKKSQEAATENLKIAEDEASNLLQNAQETANAKILAAEEEASSLLKETEDSIEARLLELKNSENEALEYCRTIKQEADTIRQDAVEDARETIAKMEEAHAQRMQVIQQDEKQALDKFHQVESELRTIESQVQNLNQSKDSLEHKLRDLDETIKLREIYIDDEMAMLDKKKAEFVQTQKDFEIKAEEYRLEERRLKAKLETDMVEGRLKTSQIQAEYDKIQRLKDSLELEIPSLISSKTKHENDLIKLQEKLSSLNDELTTLSKEKKSAQEELASAKKNRDEVYRKIEVQKKHLTEFQEELNNKDKEISLRLKQVTADTAKMTDEAHQKVSLLQKQADSLQSEFDQKRTSLMNSLNEDTEKIKAKHQAEIDDLVDRKSSLNTDSQRIVQEAKTYSEVAKAKADGMLERLKQEIIEKREQAALGIAQLNDQKTKLESEVATLSKNCEARIAEANAEAQKILSKARNEAKGLTAKLEAETNEDIRNKREQINKLLEKANSDASQMILDAENKSKEEKAKLQAQLAEIRHAETLKIQELKAKAEEEALLKKNEKAKAMATNVYATFTTEMYKSMNKQLSKELIDSLGATLKTAVVDTMLDRVPANQSKLHQILKTNTDVKTKGETFIKKAVTTGGVSVAILLTVIMFPQILSAPKNALVDLLKEDGPSNSDQFLEQVKEARIKAVFNPPTTIEFKPTYVENILYTTDYLSKKNTQAFQDKWILELNDYFIHNLDVKDTTIIKFVSLENNLIQDLIRLKDQAETSNPEPKIEEMRAREQQFKMKLSEIFEDPDKVIRYYQYAEKFWNDFHHPRVPSSQN